jgi:hypothetical protein
MAKNGFRLSLVAAAFIASTAATDAAYAVYEVEPNNDLGTTQTLAISTGGTAEVTAVLGVLEGSATGDVDFYAFEGREGDVVTLDIDGGMKASGSTARSVDTIIAIFGPPGYAMLRLNDDGGNPLDFGSVSPLDSRITNFRLPTTGRYVIGVSSWPRHFTHGGRLMSTTLGPRANGSYTLLVSGVTPLVQQINIEIKPGSQNLAPINPRSRGNIPVALLSSSEFDALTVDRTSLTFGAAGSEPSLTRCGKEGEDVNGDGRADLVCHFENQAAGFEKGDLEGILRGRTLQGRAFEGRGLLKVVPEKRDE